MKTQYDIIVAGLGAHGSAAIYQLSKTGKKVLGIDRFHPPHDQGSSHGESRIIRQAYHESPLYVPLVKAAYPLWEEIEKVSGQALFQRTGGILLGSKDSRVVQGAQHSADVHDIPYEYLDEADIQRRFPAFRPTPGTVGVLEKLAGILFPEKCIAAHLSASAAQGAEIKYNEPITHITFHSGSVELTTAQGTYIAEKVIFTTGAWIGQLFPELQLPLTIERQVLFWLGHNGPSSLPIFIWEYLPDKMFYGFPDLGNGMKIAHHHKGRSIQPDELQQDTSPEEIREMQEIASRYLDIDPVFRQTRVCMYTNTPDEDFIIDFHPQHSNVILASPCSGHGFKFSSLIGKILCDMALERPIEFDLSPFSIHRPALL